MTNKPFIAMLLFAVLLLAGCASAPRNRRSQTYTATQTQTPSAPVEPETVSSSTLKSIDVSTYSVMPFLTADLNVDVNKSVGTATGLSSNLESIKRDAMTDALKRANRGILDANIADLLIEPTFFYETRGRNVTVTVIGYPARYRNFRIIEKPEWLDASQTNQETPTRSQTQPTTQPTTPVRSTTVIPFL